MKIVVPNPNTQVALASRALHGVMKKAQKPSGSRRLVAETKWRGGLQGVWEKGKKSKKGGVELLDRLDNLKKYLDLDNTEGLTPESSPENSPRPPPRREFKPPPGGRMPPTPKRCAAVAASCAARLESLEHRG